MVTVTPGIHMAAPGGTVFAFWANPQDLNQLAHGPGGPGEVIEDVKLSPEVAGTSGRLVGSDGTTGGRVMVPRTPGVSG